MQEELIQQFQNGNKQAGDDFYMANINLVYYAARKQKFVSIDEDETLALVNQAFAYSLKNFDASIAVFSSYFMANARGSILRHYRDYNSVIRTKRRDFKANRNGIFCDSLDRVIYKGDGADIFLKDSQGIEDDYTQVMVDEALKKLNKKDGDAFKLQLRYGLSQREIGEICGCGQVTISRRITRAKAALKIILKEAC